MKRMLFFVGTLLGLFAWQTAFALPPGCDEGRPAVAYHADGTTADSSAVPMTCAVTTGFGGAEAAITVGPNGDVVEEPAITDPGLLGTPFVEDAPGPRPAQSNLNTSGLALSQDEGGSWTLVKPAGDEHACCDAALYIDRVTGRLFYSAIFGAGPAGVRRDPFNKLPAGSTQLTSSPAWNGYTLWTPPTTLDGQIPENPAFTSAPAPAGQPLPVPWENVSYWCSVGRNGNRSCYRSFDGGVNWEPATGAEQYDECGTNAANNTFPHGAPDGSLWAAVTCGATSYVVKSTDEAETWTIAKNAPTGAPLTIPSFTVASSISEKRNQFRVDSNGNLYGFQKSGTSLLMTISTDGGESWSGHLNMTAPAVRDLPPPPGGGGVNPLSILLGLLFGGGGGTASAVGQWSAAVGYEPGQVAVAYLVARSSGGQDAYISVTHDALNANPVFYASMINPPDRPMVTTTQAGDDWIMVDVGPDGTPWGSFYSDCLKDQAGNYTDPYCAQTQGVEVIGQAVGPSHATTVGRLVWQ